jgi:hypothetical protein
VVAAPRRPAAADVLGDALYIPPTMAPTRPVTPVAPAPEPAPQVSFVVAPAIPALEVEERPVSGSDVVSNDVRLPAVEVPEVELPAVEEPAAPALDLVEPMGAESGVTTYIAGPVRVDDAPSSVDLVDQRADEVPLAMEETLQDDVTLPGFPTTAAPFDADEAPPTLVVAPTMEEESAVEVPHASAPAPVFDHTDDVASHGVDDAVGDGEMRGGAVPDEDSTLVAAPVPGAPARKLRIVREEPRGRAVPLLLAGAAVAALVAGGLWWLGMLPATP